MQTSQQQDIAAIQTKLQGDSAGLLARYGANLALAGGGGAKQASTMGSPLLAPYKAA